MVTDLIPEGSSLEPGDVSTVDVSVPRTTTFTDEERTAQLRQEAAESVGRVYEEDGSAPREVINRIEGLFTVVDQEGENFQELSSEEEKLSFVDEMIDEYELMIEPQSLLVLLESDPEVRAELHRDIASIMRSSLERRIYPEELEEEKTSLASQARQMNYDQSLREAAEDILQAHIMPNIFFDEEATEERRQQAREQVEPYQQTLRQGEIIVRSGDVVTEEDVRIMEALGLQQPEFDIFRFVGLIFLILVLAVIMAYYMWKYQKEIWKNNKKLLFLELMVIVILLIAQIIDVFEIEYLFFLVPVAAASILTTVLLSSSAAVFLTVFISMLLGVYFDYTFIVVLTAFCSGMMGIFSVTRINERSDLVKAGFNVSGVMVILVASYMLVEPVLRGWTEFVRPVTVGVLNGLLVAILANGLLPYLENIFDLTSSVRLLELSNASHPLLKRLLVEAPGTYHHSVIVGNLAETAADNIDADPLLTRVAAYYHDIGKLKRPYFFTDNQFGGENPHEDISPNLSALIIKSHVKDGVELAHKYNLPQDVIDILEQHHGKNLISYFYQEAREENNSHGDVEESDFSYEGPKPQTKEAAILMLADIVEAAVRSKQFDKSDHNRIESLVQDLIRDRLDKHQLDESELTLNELNIIGECFVKVLTGIYHQRVEYPENLLDENAEGDIHDKSKIEEQTGPPGD